MAQWLVRRYSNKTAAVDYLIRTNIQLKTEGYNMHDFHFFAGGWMMFFWWFLIITLIVIVVRVLLSSNKQNNSSETPMDILKRRYANGEIDKEEFEERKKDLLK